MRDPESLLPAEVLAKANKDSSEYAWKLDDVLTVIEAANSVGLATIGGEVQFRVPEGICELDWLGFEPGERRSSEPWEVYQSRCAEEIADDIRRIASSDLVTPAITYFECLESMHGQGINLYDYLCFVLYFETES